VHAAAMKSGRGKDGAVIQAMVIMRGGIRQARIRMTGTGILQAHQNIAYLMVTSRH